MMNTTVSESLMDALHDMEKAHRDLLKALLQALTENAGPSGPCSVSDLSENRAKLLKFSVRAEELKRDIEEFVCEQTDFSAF
jgi:hypothetical protein